MLELQTLDGFASVCLGERVDFHEDEFASGASGEGAQRGGGGLCGVADRGDDGD